MNDSNLAADKEIERLGLRIKTLEYECIAWRRSSDAYKAEANRLPKKQDAPASKELVEAAKFAADVLSELYAKYGTKIGPFASQAQKANAMLGAALRAADETSAVNDECRCNRDDGTVRFNINCHIHGSL